MSNITFTEPAFAQYLYWQTQDKRTLKKIKRGSNSLQRAVAASFIHVSRAEMPDPYADFLRKLFYIVGTRFHACEKRDGGAQYPQSRHLCA